MDLKLVVCFLALYLIGLTWAEPDSDADAHESPIACSQRYRAIISQACTPSDSNAHARPCFNDKVRKEHMDSTMGSVLTKLSHQCCVESCSTDSIVDQFCCTQDSCFKQCERRVMKARRSIYHKIMSNFIL